MILFQILIYYKKKNLENLNNFILSHHHVELEIIGEVK